MVTSTSSDLLEYNNVDVDIRTVYIHTLGFNCVGCKQLKLGVGSVTKGSHINERSVKARKRCHML